MEDSDLDAAVNAFVVASKLPAPPDQQSDSDFITPEFQEFSQAFQRADIAQLEQALLRFAAELAECMPLGAARIAVFCGAMVEQGADANITGPAVVLKFRDVVARLFALIETVAMPERPNDLADFSEVTPEDIEALHASRFLAQSTVSHLAKLPNLRLELSADKTLQEQLEQVSAYAIGAEWVRGLLRLSSGTMIVLHPSTHEGFQIVWRNISNNFHLFTLLHDLLGKRLGIKTSLAPDVLEAAMGREPVYGEMRDSAAWNFFQFRGLGTANPMFYVWGEGSPAEIPMLDGMHVLLLLPLTIGRGWNGGFFAPQLQQYPPSLEILDELTRAQTDAWLGRIAKELKASEKRGK
jgi:hypothetical protein